MIRNLLAVALIAWIPSFTGPWVRRFLRRDEASPLTVPVTAAGIGTGLVTLVLFWMLLLQAGSRSFVITFAITIAVFGIGWIAERRMPPRPKPGTDGDNASRLRLWSHPLGMALSAAVVLLCAGIVFNAAYWPFEIGDALAIYGPFGKDIYHNGRLPVGEGYYESYPMLVPMTYALTHWAAGSVNEYLARTAAALMAIGTITVAGALGWQLRSPRTGLVAAALVALTPIYGRWASSGYTDIPAGFYVGLSALFACRWTSVGTRQDLVLASAFAGLALWTKNSVVTLVASLFLVVIAQSLIGPQPSRRSLWPSLLAASLPLIFVAGPWYARNWSLYGLLVPTPWTDRAQHTIASFAVMLRPDHHFGVSGWLFTAAMSYSVVLVVANRAAFRSSWMVLAAYAWPFLAVWWWAVSYEPRFLMAIVPVIATMAALMIDDGLTRMTRLTLRTGGSALNLAAMAVVAVMTAVALRQTIEHKAVLVHGLRLDDAAKHRLRIGGLYDLAMALNGLPVGSRVTGVPEMTRFHIDEERLVRMDWTARTGPPHQFRNAYDFVVLKTSDGYALFATRE